MKKLLICVAVAAIAMVSTSQAANIFTGGAGAGDPSWFTIANWDTGVPGAGDEVWLDTSVGYGPVVDAAGAQAASMIVGLYGHDGDLTINADGELYVGGNALVANGAADVGSIVNNGLLDAGILYTQAGASTVENNGTLNVNDMVLGHLGSSVSTFSNTGDINVSTVMYGAVGGDSTFNMNGGNLTVTGTFQMTHPNGGDTTFNMNDGVVNVNVLDLMQVGGTGQLNLYGGTINAAGLNVDGNANHQIDITEGVLITDGDRTGGLDWMASINAITAYGGAGTVVSEYNAGLNQTTLSAVIPEPATLSLFALLGGGMLWARKHLML